MKPVEMWSEAEHFVWEKICAGEEANFNKRENRTLPPKVKMFYYWGDWGKLREISSEFLETILFKQPFREKVTRKGVIIIGAYFPDNLDLADGYLPWPLVLEHSRFEKGLKMRGLRADRSVSLSGSCVIGALDMNIISVGDSLYVSDSAAFEEVDLRGAHIGGQLNMEGATVRGTLIMDSVSVGRSLLMRSTTFEEVDLREAHIGGQLNMDDATVRGTLIMNAVSIGSALFMRKKAAFEEINLQAAQIKGRLDMTGVKAKGKLNMEAISVGGDLWMSDGNFADVSLHFARVGLSLDLADGTFLKLDLPGATVGEGLRLIGDGKSVKWSPDLGSSPEKIQFNLQNTKVGALIDTLKSWPGANKLKLSGFTYDRLGGFGQKNTDEPTERPAGDFTNWLSRDKPFSFQPYQQLASVLRNTGKSSTADKVLFAAKERERQNTTFWRCMGLGILRYGIGYGIGTYTFRVLGWAFFFVCLGWGVLCWTGGQLNHKETFQKSIELWFFSLDYLLPIIRLNGAHYEKEVLSFGARVYFYCHQIIGYILASFLIAALSGIIKPRK